MYNGSLGKRNYLNCLIIACDQNSDVISKFGKIDAVVELGVQACDSIINNSIGGNVKHNHFAILTTHSNVVVVGSDRIYCATG